MKEQSTVAIQPSDAPASYESTAPNQRSTTKWPLFVITAGLLLCLSLALDTAVEGFLLGNRPRGFVRDLLKVAEVFGNGFGVLLVIVSVMVLDRARQAATLRLAWCSLGAGMAANVVKLMISRTRPHAANLELAQGWDTFGPFLPLMDAGSATQSFPSAHTATAAGLAMGLALLYPRGRYLFLTLTLGVGVQRMMVGAHYPSDVLVGALLGTAWATYCRPGTALGNWIGRWEDWLATVVSPDNVAEATPATLKFPTSPFERAPEEQEMPEAA